MDRNERWPITRRWSWAMPGCAALAIALAGCGSKATSVPAPTAAQAIGDFQQTAADAFEQMASRPDMAAIQLDILRETLDVRAQEYGEPFSDFRELVKEVRESWADKPSAQSVRDGVARLRDAAATMAGK